jgi:hypothetical protein
MHRPGRELGGSRVPSFPAPRCMHYRPPGRSAHPIVPQQLETTPEVDDGIVALFAIGLLAVLLATLTSSALNLRRLARHDPSARGWQQIRRLLRPLDDAAAALDAPLTLTSAGRCWMRPGVLRHGGGGG